ncbi:MAG: DUF4253 domain-containing protein [Acidimicrobiales bacterium]
MLYDAGKVAAALAGTVLGGRPVVEIPMLQADDIAFGIECGSDEVLAAWEAARAALPVTGRWPLVVWAWEGFSGPDWLPRLAEDRSRLLQMQAELRYATGDHTLGRSEFVVTVPTVDAALVERLADLARDGAEPEDDAASAPVGGDHLNWPDPPGPPAVLLLPVANGWDTLVHFDLHPSGGALGSVGRLIAVVRSWHERFGAELVANWGTALQFAVARPPTTFDEAWPLALEQVAVAPGTTGLPAVLLRHHAQALVGRRTWLLHQSP